MLLLLYFTTPPISLLAGLITGIAVEGGFEFYDRTRRRPVRQFPATGMGSTACAVALALKVSS